MIQARSNLILALLLFTITLAAGALLMVPRVCGVYHDDGIYVITSKALASNQGYRLINLPDSPAQTKYPPLYPMLLSSIWKLWPSFPENILLMQWLTMILMALSVGLCYYYVVTYEYFSRNTAVFAGLLCATSNYFLYFGTVVLTEMPFAFFTVLALMFLDRFMRSESKRFPYQLLIVVMLILPFLTRSVGIILIPVALLFLYLSRRPFRLIGLGALSVVVGWFAWVAIQTRESNPIASTYVGYASWWWQFFDVADQVRLVFTNFIYLTTGISVVGTPGLFGLIHLSPKVIPFLILFGIPTIIGIIRGSLRVRILPCFLACYLLIVILWPWPPQRFLVPMLFFFLGYWLDIIGIIFRPIWQLRYTRILAIVLIGSLIGANLVHTYRIIQLNCTTHYPYLGLTKHPSDWSSFEEIHHWININTDPTDVIACPLDPMLFLYTGRKAFRPFMMQPKSLFYFAPIPAAKPEELVNFLKTYRAKYLVQTAMVGFSEEKTFKDLLAEIQLRHPGLLKLVYGGKDPRFLIFRITDHSL